jgi:hypothetical protein
MLTNGRAPTTTAKFLFIVCFSLLVGSGLELVSRGAAQSGADRGGTKAVAATYRTAPQAANPGPQVPASGLIAGRPEDTEQWGPVPSTVTPGRVDTLPPSDAIVLFDGTSLSEWVSSADKSPAKWVIKDGALTPNEGQSTDIETRQSFHSYQLHIEWKIPENVAGSGQSRGNSGIFLAATGSDGSNGSGYELQILDSYGNRTYVNGQAGSIYKQGIPLANPARKSGEWQVYEVIWTAPAFSPSGDVTTPAYASVFFNGVLVQNHFQLQGETRYIGTPAYKPYIRAPVRLETQHFSGPAVSFRNIWIREL